LVNIIWFILLAGGIILSMFNGKVDVISNAAFAAAGNSVAIVIEITGVICLWMGLLRLAEASGLVNIIAKLAAPIARLLFPDVPRDHPAFFAILMNLAANVLGLGNAATPFGLKAMQYLQELNPDKKSASASMITFLALNTSCITLIPTLVISLRVQAGSASPTEIIGATIFATCIGTTFAVFFDRILRRRYFGR